ncbi:hypothetical protein CVD28_02265 [Bacillus sp. M6-12]|uniref:hypothetical protein n=1 Tax=Bacillus sp. M6-12 TaxID=2054166 RepID=UPI000C7606AB|nr:hypothetical protein [Bacillus sp. M6-12]PLS19257.1 hypothetical protein CVD28_02265 [Bacillus sp. M6-12]
MKKNRIAIGFSIFLISKILTYIVSYYILDFAFDKSNFIYVDLLSFVCLFYFSQRMWKETTTEMAELFTDNRIWFRGELLQWIVILVQGHRFHKVYYETGLFETNPIMFSILAMVDTLSWLILIHFWFKNTVLTIYKTNNKPD